MIYVQATHDFCTPIDIIVTQALINILLGVCCYRYLYYAWIPRKRYRQAKRFWESVGSIFWDSL